MTQDTDTSTQLTDQQPSLTTEWAIIELMGHTSFAGKISETTRFGVLLGRCDIPKAEGEEFTTCLFRGDAIYRVTFVDEATARRIANPAPVRGWQTPALRAAAEDADDEDYDAPDPFGGESCE